MANGYRDLDVWRGGMDLAADCYEVTKGFPKSETYGLTSQIRRSAVSIPANIAEGYGRNSQKSMAYFLRISIGSLRELETHILLSQRFGLANKKDAEQLLDACDHLGPKLYRFEQTARSRS